MLKVSAILVAAFLASTSRAAVTDESSWHQSIPAIAALKQQSQSIAAPTAWFSGLFHRNPSLDDLWLQADRAFHSGRYWDVRRIHFKIVDEDPTNVNAVNLLAYSLAMMKNSDVDAARGKNNVIFQESDFADLGGLSDRKLLAIATDTSADGFAKARAVYQWAEPRLANDPQFFNDFAMHVALEQGTLLLLDKKPGGLEITRQGFDEFEKAAQLWRQDPRPESKAQLSRLLLMRANLHMTLVRRNNSDDPAKDKAAAIQDYREILALPEVPDNVTVTIPGFPEPVSAAMLMRHAKARAPIHLKELGL